MFGFTLCNGKKNQELHHHINLSSTSISLLCMERLVEIIHEEVLHGRWSYNISPLLSGWDGVPPRALDINPQICICHTFFNFFWKLWFLVRKGSGVHKSQPCPISLTSCFLLQNRPINFFNFISAPPQYSLIPTKFDEVSNISRK